MIGARIEGQHGVWSLGYRGLSLWPKLMMLLGPELRYPPSKPCRKSGLPSVSAPLLPGLGRGLQVLGKSEEVCNVLEPDSLALRSATSVQDWHLFCTVGDITAPVPLRYKGHVPTCIPRKDW